MCDLSAQYSFSYLIQTSNVTQLKPVSEESIAITLYLKLGYSALHNASVLIIVITVVCVLVPTGRNSGSVEY